MSTRLELQTALKQTANLAADDPATYDAVVALAKQFLDLVDSEGRELILWEKVHLHRALEAIPSQNPQPGAVRRAHVNLENALADPACVDSSTITSEDVEGVASWDMARFRRELGYRTRPTIGGRRRG